MSFVQIPSEGSAGSVTSVNGQTGDVVLTKVNIGLSNVDNTSDANKPVSVLQQAALDLKVNKAGDTMTGALTTIAPTANGHAANKSYVDTESFINALIFG
jgi:hypothetical protein